MKLSSTISRRLLFAGIFLSALGQSVAAIGFTLLAAQTGSSLALSSVLMANLLPGILLGLVGGHLVDHTARAWWWPTSLLVSAIAYGVMALAPTWPVIVGASALVSTMSALLGTTSRKLVTHYATDSERAAGTLTGIAGIADIAGVALGGLGIGANALSLLLSFNALTLVLFAGAGFLVSTPQALSPDMSPAPKGFFDGLHILNRKEVFGWSGIFLLIGTVLGTSLDDISNVFVLVNIIGLDPLRFGITSACWATGIIVGGFLCRRFRLAPLQVMSFSSLTMGLVIGATNVFIPGFYLLVAMFLLGSTANGCFNASVCSTIMKGVPGHAQGRAWAAFRWIVNLSLMTGYVAGALWGADHPRALGVLGGSGAVLVALWFWTRWLLNDWSRR
ncbi:MFS transporter [Rothia sp. LK2588]|uniref:MFS transporter n=1 Tax=Rothia sp. LK2588 TaxID=3114369 RepID=UPI0034CD3718